MRVRVNALASRLGACCHGQRVPVGDRGTRTLYLQLPLALPSPPPWAPGDRCLPDVSHFLPGSVQCLCVYFGQPTK